MQRTVVLNIVGLTSRMLGEHTPHLRALAKQGEARPMQAILPALTCSAQSTMLTGAWPKDHGIVGNGWYFRDLSEVWLWRQSNRLVQAEKVWEAARKRDASFTCAQMFWWYNMYSSADFTVTPRPMYPADGRKIPDVYTQPSDLRDELNERLGMFPLFSFWGPNSNIEASEWVLRATRHVYDTRRPTLTLVYVPHLDYSLQKLGPAHPLIADELRSVDAACGELIEHVRRDGARLIVLSEYGITSVFDGIHINRALRRQGWLRVREELGRERLDAGISDAFAVSDHQIAHVYVQRPEIVDEVKKLVESLDGVERVLDAEGKREAGLDHPRAGELVAVSRPDRWFTYYYWLDDDRAPDYARTVDIHRKPGYDPVELFVDPALKAPKLKIGMRLAQKKAGFRTLLDVIPLDASLVRGSHGRPTDDPHDGPLFLTTEPEKLPAGEVHATHVKDLVLRHIFDD